MKKLKLSRKRCSPLPDIYTPIDKTSGSTFPKSYPCNGVFHYELVYGYPSKFLFRKVQEYSLEIVADGLSGELIITAEPRVDEDKPIKKSNADKQGSQNQ